MRTQHSTVTVADFCRGLARKEYSVNRNYQRSDAVWPQAAKSFLIETILLDYPVPKLSLHQRLELSTRTTVKDIVDGQQRSRAIMDFYENKLRLSRSLLTEEYRGRRFSELDKEAQSQFLNYGLNFDVFVAAQAEEVREVFRRMNSFTVPLNPEESRHASFQGPFKWFIHGLSRDFDTAFQACGVFTEKQINRMVDAKLITEIAHALLRGITTTSKASLDKIYRDFDVDFPQQDEVDGAIRAGLDGVLSDPDIRDTPLLKPYNVYSLALAHIQHSGKWEVDDDVQLPSVPDFRAGESSYNLSLLAEAISVYEEIGDVDEDGGVAPADDAPPSPYAEFIQATKERTNVASQRKRRFEYFLAALSA